jgi:pyruvate dehydrogenase E1 component alpha subunit
VHAAADEAVEYCRAGKGPYILEMLTYRYRGHSMSDPAKYRTREEVSKVRQERDPIERLRVLMVEEGVSDDAALKKIDKEVKDIISDAAEFAQDSPEPDLSELYTDVLAQA